MSTRHSGVQAVAVFATVLALAACGTAVDDEPSVSIGPTVPTETDGDPTEPAEPAETGPETVSPTASGADGTGTGTGTGTPAEADGTGTPAEGATAGGETTPADVPTQDAPAEQAGPTDQPSGLADLEAADAVVRQDPGAATQLLIEDVRLGLQEGYDRVVLDLSGAGEVGWLVQYAEAPVMDGSGFPVDLAGEHVLQVVAQGMAHPEPGDTAYDPGSLLLDAGELSQVTEVLRGSPFEGRVQVFIGTREAAPFRVFRLADPQRLVIDIQH